MCAQSQTMEAWNVNKQQQQQTNLNRFVYEPIMRSANERAIIQMEHTRIKTVNHTDTRTKRIKRQLLLELILLTINWSIDRLIDYKQTNIMIGSYSHESQWSEQNRIKEENLIGLRVQQAKRASERSTAGKASWRAMAPVHTSLALSNPERKRKRKRT